MINPMSLSDPKENDAPSISDGASGHTVVGDTYLLRQFREKNVAVEAEHGVRLVDVLPTIREATSKCECTLKYAAHNEHVPATIEISHTAERDE